MIDNPEQTDEKMNQFQLVARLSELGTRVLSCQARILGMGAANRQRERNDLSDAYGDDQFGDVEKELDGYADELRKLSGIDPEVIADLIADRDRLREFAKDAQILIKELWIRVSGQDGIPELEEKLFDLAARAETILEDK